MAPVTETKRNKTHPDRPETKRPKHDESQRDAFRPGLFDRSTRHALRQAILQSKPYPHATIPDLIQPDLLRRVHQEILQHLNFTNKETDIYKVNQTGDLANLDGLDPTDRQSLSSLFELRNAIYSDDFRSFISDLTGSGPLSSRKMDMSVNTYTAGCHLLNHDDVIGTRRISFILYMPGEPDEEWDPSQGGALELYPVIKPDTPATEPTVSIPPRWNQFAMFTVMPGYSFHSVQEVIVDKARLSIQGWFHFPQEGEDGYRPGADKTDRLSSLQQIELATDQEPFETYPTQEVDLTPLEIWMNPVYLQPKYMKQIADRFLDESVVQLKGFLKDELYERIKEATLRLDKQDGLTKSVIPAYGVGLYGDWFVQGSPVSQRFLRLSEKIKSDEETSGLFDQVRSYFRSETFRQWLGVVSQLIPVSHRGMARRFRSGLDYTLATTNVCGHSVLDVTLCMAVIPQLEDVTKWESCEYGGYECYMAAHEGDDDPATYRSFDDDGALLTIGAGSNELSIVLKDEGVMRFVKYVSARAPASRWDISFEYDLPEED